VDDVTQRWTWRRWQLVGVAEDEGDVVLDAIELLGQPPFDAGLGPITIRFRDRLMSAGRAETLGDQLQRWRDSENGLCDVFQHAQDPFGVFALFQGEDSVIASIHREDGGL
jgi:hypothetical protein